MMDQKLENTIGGGEENQMSEIKLGEATYIVHRSYSDTQSVPDLIINRLLKERTENLHLTKVQTMPYNI